MNTQLAIVLYVVATAAILVGVDFAFFRNEFTTPKQSRRMTPVELRAQTPLIWEHVNPYGRYDFA